MIDIIHILDQAAKLLPFMDSPKARVLSAAIGFQESRFIHRRQINGPARGFWQFERGGGVRGVLVHPSSALHAVKVCHARDVGISTREVYERLELDDILAACFARLLLYTDPRSLPEIGDVESAWEYYLRNWRPGKPHPGTWSEMYARAQSLIASEPA